MLKLTLSIENMYGYWINDKKSKEDFKNCISLRSFGIYKYGSKYIIKIDFTVEKEFEDFTISQLYHDSPLSWMLYRLFLSYVS